MSDAHRKSDAGDILSRKQADAPPTWVLSLLHEMRAVARRLDRIEERLAAPGAAPAEANPLGRLRLACEARAIPVSLDDHVDEAGAAILFGISKSGLKARRLECRCPVQHRRNLNRIEYPLAGIAEYLAGCEENAP